MRWDQRAANLTEPCRRLRLSPLRHIRAYSGLALLHNILPLALPVREKANRLGEIS